jgi:uncharacterized protein (TIGR02246 family)
MLRSEATLRRGGDESGGAEMSVHRAIEASVAELVQAWNAHDAEAWGAAFLSDASFTNVFGIEIVGREEIRRVHRHMFGTIFRDSHLEVETSAIRLVRTDVASVSVRWRMRGAYDVQGRPWPAREGLMALVLRYESRAWRIAVMHNMDLPSAVQVGAIQELLAARP